MVNDQADARVEDVVSEAAGRLEFVAKILDTASTADGGWDLVVAEEIIRDVAKALRATAKPAKVL